MRRFDAMPSPRGATERMTSASANGRERTTADAAMDRYVAGDVAAFRAVYESVAPKLRRYLSRRCRSEALVDDVVQLTLLRMHQARSTFEPGAPVMPWARAIARRAWVDEARRTHREIVSADPSESGPRVDPSPLPDALAVGAELARTVDVGIRALPPNQRRIFELVKIEGHSLPESAARLGITVVAAKLRAHRAYRALREILGTSEPDAGNELAVPTPKPRSGEGLARQPPSEAEGRTRTDHRQPLRPAVRIGPTSSAFCS